MLFTLHIDEWINYCSLIYSPTILVKNSALTHSTLLKLVHEKYSMSTTLSPSKMEWFSWKLSHFSKWKISDHQKYIRTAKRIFHEKKLKTQIMKETIDKYPPTRKNRYAYKIIPAIFLQTITKQKSSVIPIYFKFNSNLKVKRPEKQDKEIINKRETTNINNSLYNINDNFHNTTHNISNDDHISP